MTRQNASSKAAIAMQHCVEDDLSDTNWEATSQDARVEVWEAVWKDLPVEAVKRDTNVAIWTLLDWVTLC